MPSRRNDIRTARKIIPETVSQETMEQSLKKRSSGRQQRMSNNLLDFESGTNVHKRKNSKTSRSLNKSISENLSKSNEEPHDDQALNSPPLGVESKRRRSGADSYIQKRFLYDVVEPPKRSRGKKAKASRDRSTAALMAVSSANLLSRNRAKRSRASMHTEEDELLDYLHSRHGRRLKPKTEYSPSHSLLGETNYSQFRNELDAQPAQRRIKKSKKTRVRQFSSLTEDSSWPLPDLFGTDSNDQNDELTPRISPLNQLKELPNARGSPTYSDALISQLAATRPMRNARAVAGERPFARRRPGSKYLHQQLDSSSIMQSMSEVLHDQPSFSANEPSIPDEKSADLLNFCVNPHSPPQFRDPSISLEDLEAAEEDYMSPIGSGPVSGRRMPQLSNDELEEEDLLAPELSVLGGHAALTNSECALGSEANALVVPNLNSSTGGSRRKSPVRPMQVLRTKSVYSAAQTGDNSAAKADGSPFIFTTNSTSNSLTSNKQSLIGDVEYGQDVRLIKTVPKTSLIVDQPQVSPDFVGEDRILPTTTNFKPPSVVRISGLSSCDVNQVSDRAQSADGLLPPSTSNASVSSGLLPAILTQATPKQTQPSLLSRVFLTPNVGRTTTTAPSKPIHTTSHSAHSASSVTRRRPTILKRTIVADSAIGVINPGLRQPADSDLGKGVLGLTGGSSLLHPVTSTTAARVDSESGGLGEKLILNSALTTASTASGPTKLLQLVTGTPPPPPSNLTASDKLFGRRPVSYAKQSAVSSASMNLHYADEVDARPVTSSAPILSANTSYRYAVVRGSADGKRYLVLGNHGIFDRTNASSAGVGTQDAAYDHVDTGLRSQPQVLPLDGSEARQPIQQQQQSAGHEIALDRISFSTSPSVPPPGVTSLAAT